MSVRHCALEHLPRPHPPLLFALAIAVRDPFRRASHSPPLPDPAGQKYQRHRGVEGTYRCFARPFKVWVTTLRTTGPLRTTEAALHPLFDIDCPRSESRSARPTQATLGAKRYLSSSSFPSQSFLFRPPGLVATVGGVINTTLREPSLSILDTGETKKIGGDAATR